MVLAVEAVNYIALLTNLTHLDIVMNFLALAVIADFDDFFYAALFDTEYKRVITNPETYAKFLTMQTTTSFYAKNNVKGNRLKRQEVEEIRKSIDFPEYDAKNSDHSIITHIPKHIYISLSDRRLDNVVVMVIYRILRSFIVAIWFYFVPFIALLASFIVPVLVKRSKGT